MMVNCPTCNHENRVDPDCKIDTDLLVRCKACDSRFKNKDRTGTDGKIACPMCGYSQDKGNECRKCGVIFKKLKEKVVSSDSLNVNAASAGVLETQKLNKIFKSWIFLSIIYLICVIIYSMVVLPNERDRPKRDRLMATVALIEFSYFEPQVETIKDKLEDMIDRRVRKSAIYEFFETSCKALDWSVAVKKSNVKIKAIFSNGTILQFVDRNSSVHLIRSEIPHSKLFKFFPSFTELNTVYKDIDFDEMATNLQEENDLLEFSMIERRYNKSMKWLIPRFILSALLLWITPVALSFLAVCFISRRQIIKY